jgi:hypothetical protein
MVENLEDISTSRRELMLWTFERGVQSVEMARRQVGRPRACEIFLSA